MKQRRQPPDAQARDTGISAMRAAKLNIGSRRIQTDAGVIDVPVNESESPLAWLARRKTRDGNPMISPHQLLAGERLRADFTLACMTPRVTSNWSAPSGDRRGGNTAVDMADHMIACRQRVRRAMDACGPEFSGLVMDVCCFLRGLEDVERERGWPQRAAKVVLQLGLDRLARHYGYMAELRGRDTGAIRTWAWPDDEAQTSLSGT